MLTVEHAISGLRDSATATVQFSEMDVPVAKISGASKLAPKSSQDVLLRAGLGWLLAACRSLHSTKSH